MKPSDVLREAYAMWAFSGSMSRVEKRSAIERLTALRFSDQHIARLLNVGYERVRLINNPDNRIGGVRAWFDKFEPATLDAMLLMAKRWEQDETVSPALTRLIVQGGTGVHALAYYTGVPVDNVRSAVHG